MPNLRHKKKLIRIFLLITLAVIGYYSGRGSVPAPAVSSNPGLQKVEEVVDGDTIVVQAPTGYETVRLIGIDTPETKDPRKPEQCFGKEATARAQQLVGGKSIKLVADPGESNRDKYKRLLRYVYLPDGTLLNAKMIAEGYAFSYELYGHSKLGEFHALEQSASLARLGLWSACTVEGGAVKQTK